MKEEDSMYSVRVNEILSWYAGETPGTLKNLARILNHGKLGSTGKKEVSGLKDKLFNYQEVNPPTVDTIISKLGETILIFKEYDSVKIKLFGIEVEALGKKDKSKQ